MNILFYLLKIIDTYGNTTDWKCKHCYDTIPHCSNCTNSLTCDICDTNYYLYTNLSVCNINCNGDPVCIIN